MIEATKGPVLPRQTLREWVLQQRRSGRSVEAVDRFTEILKLIDGKAPVVPPPPKPGATPELEAGTSATVATKANETRLETVASAEDAVGETMDQVAPRKARKSWTRRNVLKPNVTRKASRIVKRSAKEEERNQRNQRDAPAKAAKKARKGGRPQQGATPMTPAERVKAYRERKRAEAAKGGKTRRGRKG